MKMTVTVALIAAVAFAVPSAHAVVYRGVEFPDGPVSFADEVVSFTPGSGVSGGYLDENRALGIPDNSHCSLGDVPGAIVLRFVDNSLTTSGTPAEDLWVFEVGAAIEPTDVWVGLNATDWIYVGATGGSTSGVDLDAYIGSGIVAGVRYSYVRLAELRPLQSGSPYAGADIDAVGAISSAAPVPDAAATVSLVGLALMALAGLRRRISA